MKEDYSEDNFLTIDLTVDDDYENQNRDFMPERKLFSEVIKRAVQDLKNDDPTIYESAREWLAAEEVERPEFTSFQSLCDILDLDFKTLKQAIFLYNACDKSLNLKEL